MILLDHSWYGRVLEERVERTIPEKSWRQAYRDIAQWTIIEATSKWYARKKVFETLIAAMERRLGANAPPRSESTVATPEDADLRETMESLGESK
jgi:polyphosphate kinase 2 (PPK2 family)